MICFLARIFLKDYSDVKHPKVRQSYGVISGLTGIFLNVFLFIIKFLAGIISNSISITGDAFNNLSDAASSIVTLVGFKLSGEEADEQHPFGHGRVEYIAGLIVSLFIIIMGIELAQSSVKKIFHPESVEFNALVAAILIISILVKLLMFQGNLQAAKLIESAALKSTALDSISDVFTTSIVLLSNVFAYYTGITVDGYFGVLVGFFIIKTGFEAAKDTISPLLGEPPSKEFIDDVKRTVLSHGEVLGVHDIVVHNYGPSRIFMSLHVEVPSDSDIITIHDIIDDIENELRLLYHCTAVIHMDPVASSDKETLELKKTVGVIIKQLSNELSFHDLRIINHSDGSRRISLDVNVPYKFTMSDEEIEKFIVKNIGEEYKNATFDVTIDKVVDKEIDV